MFIDKMWPIQEEVIVKDKKIEKRNCLPNRRCFLIFGLISFACLGWFMYQFFLKANNEGAHPYREFKDRLREVCANPILSMPEYRGVSSFFNFLLSPDQNHCYSWLEFGGEKIMSPRQNESDCEDEIRKTKMICFNEEYKMTHDPCLVYSFTKDNDSQFERDMHMFSCNVHAFDAQQVQAGENVRRTEFWLEHAWDISEYPYDEPADDHVKSKYLGGVIRKRSLDYITHVLEHEGRIINYIKSDTTGREWVLLRQIITHSDLVDIQQIGVRIHVPPKVNKMTGSDRHEYFKDLFQIFQGLTCLGYKYILARPVNYFRERISIPELTKTYYVAYEVNFAKVLK